jgi:plasmid maintenance system killer protein
MITSIKHKGLRKLYVKGRTKRLPEGIQVAALRRLDALAAAGRPADLALPGFDLRHELGKEKRFTLVIDAGHRIRFRWTEDGPTKIDLLQAGPVAESTA